MSAETADLRGVIKRNMSKLDQIYESLGTVYEEELSLVGKTNRSALMVSGLLENYYTCLETTFLRISRFFENSLDSDRWHSDLLEKMTISIEGVRIPVVSDENHSRLLELLKFRHFRRYYSELEYDWDRLEFLTKKLNEAHPIVVADLQRFDRFLVSL